MDEPSNRDDLLLELERERSIRRTVRLLYAKRSRMREDLNRLISHLALLVAVPQTSQTEAESQSELDILIEAAKRINDPLFTDLLIEIIQARKS